MPNPIKLKLLILDKNITPLIPIYFNLPKCTSSMVPLMGWVDISLNEKRYVGTLEMYVK